MKFILLIIVKMPTVVGIFTFISRISITYESSKARKVLIGHCVLVFIIGMNFIFVDVINV